MKKILVFFVVLIFTSVVNAQLTRGEADKLVESLDWSGAQVEEQNENDSFMRLEKLPNAIRFTLSEDYFDTIIQQINEIPNDKLTAILDDPRLTCYALDEKSSNDSYARALIQEDYQIALANGEHMFTWGAFPAFLQIQDSRFICQPEIKEYTKQSIAQAYNDNAYALGSQHYLYKNAFKFTGVVKNIENRNAPAVIFDIEKPKFSGINVINMTQLVCAGILVDDVVGIKAGQEISVVAWDLRTWDSPRMERWLRFSTPGEVVANCQMF